MIIRTAINEAFLELKNKNIKSSLLDSEILMSKVLNKKRDYISYNDLNKKIFSDPVLIVNCTPIGTYPNVNSSPNLPYDIISDKSIFFDLVYNPEETLFMKKGNEIGCLTINGYQMLKFQAEESWNLWQRK